MKGEKGVSQEKERVRMGRGKEEGREGSSEGGRKEGGMRKEQSERGDTQAREEE